MSKDCLAIVELYFKIPLCEWERGLVQDLCAEGVVVMDIVELVSEFRHKVCLRKILNKINSDVTESNELISFIEDLISKGVTDIEIVDFVNNKYSLVSTTASVAQPSDGLIQ